MSHVLSTLDLGPPPLGNKMSAKKGPSFMTVEQKPLISFLEIHPTFLFRESSKDNLGGNQIILPQFHTNSTQEQGGSSMT